MTDEVGVATVVTVDQQVPVNRKLQFRIKLFENGVEVPMTEPPLITLSDDTPAAVVDGADGWYYYVPADDSVGAIIQLRAKYGSGDDAVFGSFTVENIAAVDVPPPPVTRTISFEFGALVPK